MFPIENDEVCVHGERQMQLRKEGLVLCTVQDPMIDGQESVKLGRDMR
jgi:hypothetical protein